MKLKIPFDLKNSIHHDFIAIFKQIIQFVVIENELI